MDSTLGGALVGIAGEFVGGRSGAGRFSFSKPVFNPFSAGLKDGLFGFLGGFVEDLVRSGLRNFECDDEGCNE